MSDLKCLKSDPMKNDLVLQNIFKFCDVPSLKNIRLVSSKWRDLSLKTWRHKAVIQLGTTYTFQLEFKEFLRLINPEDEYYDDSFKLVEHPFKQYSWELDWVPPRPRRMKDYRKQIDIARAIVNAHAYHVKVIWVSRSFEGFKEMLAMLNSDSMESLEVRYQTLFFDESVPASVEPLKGSKLKRLKIYLEYASSKLFLSEYLLKCFLKVESLAVSYSNAKTSVAYPMHLADRLGIAKTMKNLRLSRGDDVLPLKELEIMKLYSRQEDGNREEIEIIDTLAACNFPLERLSIHVGWHGKYDRILIFPLLESCRKTLQYLKASINFNDAYYSCSYRNYGRSNQIKNALEKRSIPEQNVQMEALTEMHLVNGLEYAMFLLAHVDTPEMKKLTVEYGKGQNHNQSERYGFVSVHFPLENVYEKLETFQLLDNHSVPKGKMIRSFANMMPNLTHLTMPLEKKTFPLICQHFKGLKTLHIPEAQSDYVEIDDEGLTGIAKAKLSEGENTTSRRPNITDLEHLTDLSISCQRQFRRGELKFTEHSVMYGFLQLPRLYYLSVAVKELSKETEEKLLSHVKGHVDLQRKLKPDPSTFEVEIVRENHEFSSDDDSEDGDSS